MSYKLAGNPVYLVTKHAYFVALDICIELVVTVDHEWRKAE